MASANEEHWFEYKPVGDVLVVILTRAEWFYEQACDYVGRQLLARVEDGIRRMVLNFQGVDRLSSDMLGELIALHKRLQSVNGKLVLCCIKPKLTEVFQVLKLDQLFTIVASEEEAVALLTVGGNGGSPIHG